MHVAPLNLIVLVVVGAVALVAARRAGIARPWLVGLVGFFAIASVLTPANGSESADEVSEQLQLLLDEIRSLRHHVEQLEMRVNRMEQKLAAREIPLTMDDAIKAEDILPRQYRLSPRPQTGLYVFPGLDAPPLTPMDALAD